MREKFRRSLQLVARYTFPYHVEGHDSWNEYTNICTYRVKPGAREQFIELLRRHWPTLRAAGLATETPALHFEAGVGGDNRHNGSGTTFVEIFSWSSPDAAEIAHQTSS